jgi:hypothetical protein
VDVAGAAATKVERKFFYFFARTGVLDKMADVDDALEAGVRVVLVVVAWCCRERIAGWRYSVLAAHGASASSSRAAGE